MKFERVRYENLNSRQKENYNFQKVSALLADYGFVTIRLSDDWQGADFIAHHISGDTFLKVQLKGRLTVDTKYKNKDIWICFHQQSTWYLLPHDDLLRWALENLNIANTDGWFSENWQSAEGWQTLKGAYSWPYLSKKASSWLTQYALGTTAPTSPQA